MSERKTILIGLDLFESSLVAMVESIRIREWSGAELIATHVIDERLWHQVEEEFQFSLEAVIQRAESRIRNEIIELAHSPDQIKSVVVVGHPVTELLQACQHYKPDLLVLGAQGSHESDSPELGNVASRLLRQATVDVLIVRKTQTHPFKKVVACVDLSDNSDSVIKKAIDIAEEDEAVLEIVHVIPHFQERQKHRGPLEALGFYEIQIEGDYWMKVIDSVKQKLNALLEKNRHLIHRSRVHTHLIVNDDPVAGILGFAEESQSELLVLSKQGHSRLKESMLGATVEKIANQARASVMAVT